MQITWEKINLSSERTIKDSILKKSSNEKMGFAKSIKLISSLINIKS